MNLRDLLFDLSPVLRLALNFSKKGKEGVDGRNNLDSSIPEYAPEYIPEYSPLLSLQTCEREFCLLHNPLLLL